MRANKTTPTVVLIYKNQDKGLEKKFRSGTEGWKKRKLEMEKLKNCSFNNNIVF